MSDRNGSAIWSLLLVCFQADRTLSSVHRKPRPRRGRVPSPDRLHAGSRLGKFRHLPRCANRSSFAPLCQTKLV